MSFISVGWQIEQGHKIPFRAVKDYKNVRFRGKM